MMTPMNQFSRRQRPLTLACLLALGVVSREPLASAQSASLRARSLFQEARRLMGKKNFVEACPKFEEPAARPGDGHPV